jgi:hypothetical protein
MAGLLDLFNSDDGKLGIALLAAAGPSMQPMGFGQRLQGAMQSIDADKQNQMKMGLLKSQIDENASQAAQRRGGGTGPAQASGPAGDSRSRRCSAPAAGAIQPQQHG